MIKHIDLGPDAKPNVCVVKKENKEKNNVIKIDDVDNLPDFGNIFDDFKDCEEVINQSSKEDI